MAFNKITDYESNIKVLPDRPSTAGITPDQLKRLFDGRTDKEVKILFNQLIDDLLSDIAAGQLGAMQIDREDDSSNNLQAKLLFLKNHTDTLVSKMIDDIRDNISEAQRKAEEAAQKAEVAQDRAETAAENAAQEAAEEAVFNVKELLEEHVADSEAAKLGAETAQSEAENSQKIAMNSQIMAERAQYKAEEAQAKAEAAADKADAYSSQAQTSAVSAFSYSTQANTSREMAEAAEIEAKAAQGMAEIAKGEAEAQAEAAREQALIAEEKARVAAQDVVALLLQYIQQSENAKEAAEDAAEEAQTSASEAQGYADSINPDEMKRLISARGDNLEYDEAENLLYLTANGIRISDGIKVISSGGGGGGGSESNNAVLTLKNTTGFLYKTIAYGNDLYIKGEWSSIEDEMQTGPGVMKVTANGSVKISRELEQGAFSINVGQILTAGENNVKFSISDTYGNSRSINFNITAVSLRLTSSFDANKVYTGSFAFPYTPTAAVTKTMHFIIDGNEIGTAVVLASGREQTFTIPAQPHGMHTLEAYYKANIDGEDVESDRLYYNIGCAVEGDNTPIIIMDMREETAEQFDTVVIPWRVYDPASLTANVTLTSAAGSQNLTVDRTEQSWSYRPEYAGEDVLTISCVGSGLNAEGVNALAVVQKVLNVTESSIDVEAETSGLSLYLASYGRSNNEENPSEWTYGAVEAELENFNFTSDGWQNDEKGVTVLRVSGDARVNIPVEIFREDFRTTGKTIEIEFASRNVLDYDAVIASCMSGSRGLEITAQQAGLYSEQSEIGTRYKEDEHIRLTFVVEKRSAGRLLLCYLNGVLSGASVYPADDDFSQTNPLGISIGSNECTIDIYNIRIYDNDLTRFQILDNWIADTAIAADKAERFRRNDIFDEYGSIVIEKLPDDLPYMVINTPVLPAFKGDKKTCSGYYIDPVNMKNNFSFTDATIDVQGTSSQYYRVKNFKIKFGNGFILWDDTVAERYMLDANVVPTNEYTMKADVASQEGANNVVLADMFNELCPVKTPAQEDDKRIRQTIFGKPIVIFHDSGNGPKFVGKYNFNNDKGTAEVFGFEEGDESWEILQNGTDRVGWRSSDFIGDGWKNDFEARYPEDNTNTTRLATFASWISITNPDNATNQMLTSPVVYNNFTYTQDTAAYRLARFHDELPLYASVRQSIFYYLFTLTFLCIDQREKNAFPTYINRMGKWLWLFYDADSSLGKDNKGNHTFDFYLEDIDYTEGGDPVFNGQNSVFWKNLRSTYWEEIKAEYQRLRTEIGADGYPLLSYEGTIGRYKRHQGKWPEAIYNEDGWIKSIEAWTEDGETMYLPMLVGKAELWIMWWLYNRFRYLDSLFETGTSLTNRITIRAHAKADVKLISYVTMYGRVYFNADMVGQRMFKDTEYTFHWDASGAEDPVIGINDADRLTSLGDLSPLFVELIDVSKCEHLTFIKLGDGAENYRNTYLNSITFGNNPLLVSADIRNCVNLTMAPDFSGCTNIEEIYLDGTAVTGVTLPNGGILKKLHLPDTIKNLTVLNQKMLSEFVLGSYSQIETLRLENVPSVIDSAAILAEMPSNSRIRLIGFEWNAESAEAVLTLYDRLDTMRGQDENGNNVDKAQMQGVIHVDNITGADLAELQSRYPSITIDYKHITSYVYFYNYNGTSVLYTATSVDGAEVKYSGSTPTKPATAQYNYTFSGWSKTMGGAADANALKKITGDRNVYPAFTSTVRTYTVTWVNDGVTLETDTGVPYGTVPTYNGSTPVDGTNGLAFIGWEPEVKAITGDTTYTAKFESPVVVAEITDSWDTILDNVVKNRASLIYNIGNYKPLDLGAEGVINMQIVAFDTDTYADGSGKAPVTWVARELLATRVAYTASTTHTILYGGWEQSNIRAHLRGNIYPLIPANVSARIATVAKEHTGADASATLCPQTTQDTVWIPSREEVDGGSYSAVYPDDASRIKTQGGSAKPWVLRSLQKSQTPHAISTQGAFLLNENPQGKRNPVLSFCLGVSEIADSWDTIIANINAGTYKDKYKIGDWKAVDLGTHGTIRMQIAAFDTDELADGSGTAAVTWLARETLATTQTGRSHAVWSTNADRTYLANTILPLFPSNIRSNIKSVNKSHLRQHSNGSSVEGVYETETTQDSLWIPSAAEVGIGLQTSGYSTHYTTSDAYELFAADNVSRKRNKIDTGSSYPYSLRDAAANYPADSLRVMENGDWASQEGEVSMLIGFCMGKAPSQLGKVWKQSNITGSASTHVKYADDMWVANTDDKGVCYSMDGITWTQSNWATGASGSGKNIKFAFDGSVWVGVGKGEGGNYYSTDGKTWVKIDTLSAECYGIAYDNGVWLAGALNGGIYYSEDGVTWAQSNVTSGTFYNFAYGNGVWVASASGAGTRYSTDGKTWSEGVASGNFAGVVYGGGLWVVHSKYNLGLRYSSDGATWTQSNVTSGRFYALAYDNGLWVAGSGEDKGIYYSTDGITWTQSNVTSGTFNDFAYGNGVWMASATEKGVYYSVDGVTWTQSDLTSGTFNKFAYGKGKCVVGGNDGLYYSK